MLLQELRGRRPKRAGKAIIEYDSQETYPRREGSTIILPYRGDLQLYKLQKDWNQFIARLDYSTGWFGGTDENPFLVRISNRPFDCYCRYGPDGFYNSLIPDLPGKTHRRQGDIFACPIPFSWEEIVKACRYIDGMRVEVLSISEDRPIFGTRHSIRGQALDRRLTIKGDPDSGIDRAHERQWYDLVEGTVVAPDHTPMELIGVHVLAQTLHLTDAKNAD